MSFNLLALCRFNFLNSNDEKIGMSESKYFGFVGVGRSWWHWVVGGALYGVLMRVLFVVLAEKVHYTGGLMSVGFLIGTPFAIGALTAYGIRKNNPTWVAHVFMPWVTVGLMLFGCAITLLEGSICLAIMSPLFLICGSIGGLAMGFALRFSKASHSKLKAVALLPLLILIGETQVPLTARVQELTQSVDVNAAPETVWKQILSARSIQPKELPFSLTHFIGVPKPVEGINTFTPEGEVRFSKWEHDVSFRGAVTNRKENESISWRYVFDAHSFPEGSMDDHVAIGGRYFDLKDTTFNLHRLPSGGTRLEIVAHYQVTSSINFYAIPMANLLGNDFIATILGLYKGRSEKAEHLVSET